MQKGAVRSQGVPSEEPHHQHQHQHHQRQAASVLGREGADPQWGAETVPPVGAVAEQLGVLGCQDRRRRMEGVQDCRQVEGVVACAGGLEVPFQMKREEEEEEETYRVQVRWGLAGEMRAQTSAPWWAVGLD